MQDSCQSDLVRFLPQDSCKILCEILDRSYKILARLAMARTINILVRKWTFPYPRHVASISDTFGRKNHVWAYRGSLRSAHCRNVTKVGEFVVKLPITGMLHSTNYIAVFIGQVQGVLHMSSFGGTVRWEKSHFCLPSFSAKLTLLECHQCKGVCGPTSYCQYVTQH